MLLKKGEGGGEEEGAGAGAGEKRETALERMERETAEREKASLGTARPTRERGESSGERAPIPVDDRPRRFGVGRPLGEEGARGAALGATAEGEASNKVPELAPIKLSALRKTPSEGFARPSPSSSSSTTSAAPAPSSAPAPAPAHIIDDSRYAEELKGKGVVSSKKANPLDRAIREKESVTEKQLSEGLAAVNLEDEGRRGDVGVVVARSLIEGKLTLEAVTKALEDPRVLLDALKAYRERKGEKELLALVHDSGVSVLPLILPPSPTPSPADTDAFLTRHGLLALKPIPDLTADLTALLSASAPPQQIIDALNAALPPTTPIPALTRLITSHVFTTLFTPPSNPTPSKALPPYLPLLTRVANDPHARLLTLYAAQAAWFKAGGLKGALRDLMGALKEGGVVRGVDVVAWRDDLVEGKGVGGKPKALLQVSGWVKEVEEEVKRERPREEVEEEGEGDEGEDDDEDEDEDDDEEDYPRRM